MVQAHPLEITSSSH